MTIRSGVPADAHPLQRATRLVGEVRCTIEQLITDGAAWQASAKQRGLLADVSTVTNLTLPGEAIRSASVALGFLLAVMREARAAEAPWAS